MKIIDDAVPMEKVALSLVTALGARDLHTRDHSDRVVQLSIELGQHIELSADELAMLALGAQFHDLGKIGIPDKVLCKTTPFEADEWACMQQHTVIGEQIISAMNGKNSPSIARTVRHHHEHFDGSGYPDGLRGTDIPLYSRIISLTDSYDAMITTRAYHQPRPHREVMAILECEAGSKHDPDLLHAFRLTIEKSSMRGPDA